ncbi:Gfo/Idh/MocA family protein, partial [Belliella pelovolcani]|uniref:Gfo/Idh/MocA family protein n=1 Tax=Belliella pelovolcani TaxID=529505 RepID=UPI00391D0187
EKTKHKPAKYSGNAYAWKKMVERDDIDLIYIATPWDWHVPMAVYAMEAGKHAAVEVPAAKTLEECWQLVETSERTQKHCMMLENCCYDFFELMTLNMARDGFFGDILHAEGAYIHDLLDLNFAKNAYEDMWRLKENYRDGNLYATHGLGPIAQLMDINRGDQMDYLTSLSSADFHMGDKARELAEQDNFYASFVEKQYGGNMNTTIIRTKHGKSMMVQHDVTSPRPYSRLHALSGTKAFAQKYPVQRVSSGHGWIKDDEMKVLQEKYTPEIVKKVGELAKTIGGHGGMDFMMEWRLVDCLRNGLPLDQDVYDAALWSAISPLSEWSVAHRSNSIDVPDFTGGSWKTNKPVDITLNGGGTTKVIV